MQLGYWLESSTNEFVTACYECDYDKVFSSQFAQSLLRGEPSSRSSSVSAYLGQLSSRVHAAAVDEESRSQLLLLGITLLNAFLQVNFTGPALPKQESLLTTEGLFASNSDEIQGQLLEELVVDGERPYPLVENVLYLRLALSIIEHESLSSVRAQPLWHMRVSFVHQTLLDDPVSTIHNIICDEESVQRVNELVRSESDLESAWHLERAHYYSYYSYDQKAMYQLKEAQKSSGLSMQVSGALGRRTKFQKYDISQLVVLAKSRNTSLTPGNGNTMMKPAPKELDLNDDTLLEKVSFTTTNEEAPYSNRHIDPMAKIVPPEELPADLAALDPGNQPQLKLVDQCILLTLASIIKVSAASDDQIIIEQVAAYVARVLLKTIDSSNPESNWSVNSAALLARTRIEGHRSRTVERSVLQLQALVDQLVDEMNQDVSLPSVGTAQASEEAKTQTASFLRRADQTDSAPAKERLLPLFSLPLASKWDLQLELARKYVSIGLVRSALEIFERLESWEQVAMCYGVMDREDKAETILREQIKLAKPGSDMPKLWCLLGDVTSNPEYWQESWRVSGDRYARAQRSLGKHYFAKKDYGSAVSAYALSLKINPLNHGAWFIYGCAALETQQFQVAAEAFTRCISIDQQDGESWNNLASALLRLGGERKKDAWQALKTATELKYDSWRMWENYMLVSFDLHELADTVRAMRRCIEIRKDQGEGVIDVDVLQMLVQEIISAPDSDPAELRGPAKMLHDLLINVIQPLITHDARLWRLMARVHIWRGRYTEALDAHEKAYRCLAGRAVETELPAFQEVVEAVEELVDAYRSLGPMDGRMGGLVAKDWKFKARSVVRTLKGRGSNFEDSPAYDKLTEILEDLKSA